jgi:tetratricopeptide (TPR) repeat protein
VPLHEKGLTDLLIGEGRQVMSLSFFNQADQYFHKGVAHLEAKADTRSIFQRWEADITPEQHAHAEGAASAEILPWLKLSAQSNPHNVDAFLVAAFWAATGLQRHDIAAQILDEARRLNPEDYRIPLEKGRLAIRTGDFESAFSLLECARTLQARADHAGVEPAHDLALDKASILVLLGFLNELRGAPSKAIDCFKNALAIFPDRVYIKERVVLLEAGQAPPNSARSLLELMTRQSVHDACHDEGRQDHGESHEGHDHAD